MNASVWGGDYGRPMKRDEPGDREDRSEEAAQAKGEHRCDEQDC